MRSRTFAAPVALALFAASFAHADEPNGAGFVRALGERAPYVLSNGAGIAAIVRLPRGDVAGVKPLAAGFGSVRGTAAEILAFSGAHPELTLEVSPPLHLLMDRSKVVTRADIVHTTRGLEGAGVVVGVVDSGIDASHPDFRFPDGRSRIKWHLDLSRKPLGLHPDLEARFKVSSASGDFGAVMNNDDIDAAILAKSGIPSDTVGHGTHVAGIAAAGSTTAYGGMAPKADLVIVHATRENDTIDPVDMVLGAQFVMDRAESMGEPAVVNLSLGTDFGPHDGTLSWETMLAGLLGSAHPGHAIVAAAGNSGSIAESPVHAGVHVAPGATFRVGMDGGRASSANVSIWVALRPDADVKIGLEGPSGAIIPLTERGTQFGRNVLVKDENDVTLEKYNAGVIFGEGRSQNLVPPTSSGAIVALSGQFQAGRYNVTLEGNGDAELYMQVSGDVRGFSFTSPVREGTINLPATHPDIIGVGCTVSRSNWTSIAGIPVTFGIPRLDGVGGRALSGDMAPLVGDVCWFSSAGPNLNGVPKPEIGAPGGTIISAMSVDAPPSSGRSVFHTESCPLGGRQFPDRRCLQIDETHAVLTGTSMSSPMVAGGVALLLQADPTLTQSEIAMLLQAGAHHFRGASPYEGQAGVGELDVESSLLALRAYRAGSREGTPVLATSWVSLSAETARAGRSIPVTALFELRTAEGLPADLVAGDALSADVFVDGERIDAGRPFRKGPGIWQLVLTLPEASGGKNLRVSASMNGAPIVPPKEIPIATDSWTGLYPSSVHGGCAASPAPSAPFSGSAAGLVLFALTLRRRRPRTRAD